MHQYRLSRRAVRFGCLGPVSVATVHSRGNAHSADNDRAMQRQCTLKANATLIICSTGRSFVASSASIQKQNSGETSAASAAMRRDVARADAASACCAMLISSSQQCNYYLIKIAALSSNPHGSLDSTGVPFYGAWSVCMKFAWAPWCPGLSSGVAKSVSSTSSSSVPDLKHEGNRHHRRRHLRYLI